MRWFNIQPKRLEFQQKALERALEIYNSDPEKHKNTMFCPFCGEALIPSGRKRRMQTLTEHVSGDGSYAGLRNEYVCPGHYYGETVPGCKYGALHAWNDDIGGVESGGCYVSKFSTEIYEKHENGEISDEEYDKIKAVDTFFRRDIHTAALNTFEAKSEVDCYKTGLRDTIRLWPWLTLNIIQLTIDLSFEADDFGRVKKTWVHLGFLKRDKDRNDPGFCLRGSWAIGTWKYLLWKWKDEIKKARSAKSTEQKMRLLATAYGKSFNRSWPYKWFEWFITRANFIESHKVLEYFGWKDFKDDYELHKLWGYGYEYEKGDNS